jgi:hypothetical protein
MSNKIIPNKYMLLIATIVSAMLLAASPMASLLPTTAFAEEEEEEVSDGDEAQLNVDSNNQEDISDVEESDNSVVVDPTIQTSVQTAVNVNLDNDVVFSTECADIHDDDEVTQVNQQVVDQKVHNNNDVGDGGVIVEPTIQTSVQTAANINNDNDVFIVWGCDDGDVKVSDNDKVTQVNQQIANQEALSDSEAGDGGMVIDPTIQTSRQTAINHNEDDDRVIVIGGL